MRLLDASEWAAKCQNDGEFVLASRAWSGGLELEIGTQHVTLFLDDGRLCEERPDGSDVIRLSGSKAVWEKLLAAVPERFNNDVMANLLQYQGLVREADPIRFAQYYPAVARAIELLRPSTESNGLTARGTKPNGAVDAPVGRYINLELGGANYRVYFEEAGQGIPVLMQHTAGCHSSQWRHLFEMPEITDHFRLIAYDLPFHGKSLPPEDVNWWEQSYKLSGDFLRSVPLQISQALELDRPVFMGCSVGGLLALDLAARHSDQFRSVISIEGALEIPGSWSESSELWHPQVSNEYKARFMDALMSPLSPKRYRKETSFIYSAAWPPVFQGDLYYYLNEYDLTESASQIDTHKTAVHILSGEYDCSATTEMGYEAHQNIAGSTWAEMKGVGHFPMSENPTEFKHYLLPILQRIAAGQ